MTDDVVKEHIRYPNSNRIGQFSILFEMLEQNASLCAALFASCVIIKVDQDPSGRGFLYYAASELFEPLGEDEEIPKYRIEATYDQPFENADWQRRRVNSGRWGFVAIRQIIVRVPPARIGVTPGAPNLH